MLVDLGKVRDSEQPLLVDASFDEAALGWSDEGVVRLERPVQVRLRVLVQGERVRVAGGLEADLRILCCRCLSPFQRRLEKAFDLEYAPDPEVEPEGEERELKYQDLEVGFYRNDELDLRNVVGEQIFLEIPMKPLCREDCQGLCDQCGADLNQGDCGCRRESFDPRLAALLDLKKRIKDRN